jgi:hypothetical protein
LDIHYEEWEVAMNADSVEVSSKVGILDIGYLCWSASVYPKGSRCISYQTAVENSVANFSAGLWIFWAFDALRFTRLFFFAAACPLTLDLHTSSRGDWA